jgi:transposase
LPKSLARIETVIDIESRSCPCCGGALHPIGEDVAERLDIVPGQFRVLVVRRPKYVCRACPGTMVQVPAPPRLIEGGLPTEALVAHVISGSTRTTVCPEHPAAMEEWSCVRDEGRPLEAANQVEASNHRELLS